MNPFNKFQTICLIFIGIFTGTIADFKTQCATEKKLGELITMQHPDTYVDDVDEVVQKTKAEWRAERKRELKRASALSAQRTTQKLLGYSSTYRIERADLPGFTPAMWPDEGGAIEVENPEIYIDMDRLEGEITITVLYHGQCEDGERCLCDCYFSRTFTDEEFINLFQ